MQHYFAALTVILLIGMVLTRVLLMEQQGIKAMKFGNIDKKDFLIPPFALFYFYIIFAEAFPLPTVSRQQFFQSDFSSWIGVTFCACGLGLLLWSLISFGRSFRVGIDTDRPDRLVTSGIFAVSRNPIYVAFASVLRRPVPDFSELDIIALRGRSHMAVPPPSNTRRRISEETLRRGICKLLQTGTTLFVTVKNRKGTLAWDALSVCRCVVNDRGRDTSLPGTPRTDPDGRSLAHPVLISDE